MKNNKWITGKKPILTFDVNGDFNNISVKDLSIVYFDGLYHMFYTASGKKHDEQEYTIGYAKSKTLCEFKNAEQRELKRLKPEFGEYYCAPQVFYFQPHKLWYLVYQIRSSVGHYSAVYSTNTDINNFDGWSKPKDLLSRNIDPTNHRKWIDFWCIQDDTDMYLFYSSNGEMAFRKTTLEHFPNNFSNETLFSVSGGYEASHIYKNISDGLFYMIFEGGSGKTPRSFVLARTDNLDSKNWEIVDSSWVCGENMSESDWTDMPSHGEFIRLGYDSKFEIADINKIDFLIQGVKESNYIKPYPYIPWSIGLISNYIH